MYSYLLMLKIMNGWINHKTNKVVIYGTKGQLVGWGSRGQTSLNTLFCRFNFGTHVNILHNYIFKKEIKGFPGGAVVESLPANAGDTGSSPGLGRSHMPRSNWAREPQSLSLRAWSLCSATREAAIVRGPRTAMKSGPRLPQLEKALAQKRRPNTTINK